MNPPKAIFCWSGGKDSALALHRVLSEKTFDVRYLLTTVNKNFSRVSMHGVREELLNAQAIEIGIPLLKVYVSEGTNSEYEKQMEQTLLKVKSEGIEHVIFGDIFLEDLRKYRENNLGKIQMKAIFPLWKKNTSVLIGQFLQQGFKTVTCCTNVRYLGEDKVGVEINKTFISELPAGTDPCGENGEFHTFCYDGPLFRHPVKFELGEKIFKPLEIKTTDDACPSPPTTGFWFCDLIPV